MAEFDAQVIEEFRANEGVVGGMFDGMPLLLLHHTGAQSGQARIAPLVYFPGDDQYVIFASKGGAPKHPSWYHNLLAHPETKIEVGSETIPVTAVELTGDDRERAYNAQVAVMPQFGDYQAKTTRTIPAIALVPR